MDVNQFYGFFSTTCLALVGLWWGVVDRRRDLLADPARRREVGAVYLTFLLPGLMGLLAQVGGTANPVVWRVSFVVVAVIGAATTVLILDVAAREGGGLVPRLRWVIAGLYGVVAGLGAAPRVAGSLGLTALQAEALLLVLLVAVGHGLVWSFLARPPATRDPEPR